MLGHIDRVPYSTSNREYLESAMMEWSTMATGEQFQLFFAEEGPILKLRGIVYQIRSEDLASQWLGAIMHDLVDPEATPWDRFVRMVREYLARLPSDADRKAFLEECTR